MIPKKSPRQFSVWEWYFIDILNLSSHTSDFSLSMADIFRTVSKVVSGPCPTSTTMRSGNPHLSWQTTIGPCLK